MRKPWRPVACALSVCLVLQAAGCHSAQHDAAAGGAKIEPGMTREEVLYRLGDPDVVVRGDDGADSDWIYRYEGGPGAVGTVLIIVFAVALVAVLVVLASGGGGGGSFGGWGGGGGGSDGPPYQIKIHFDNDGRVVEISPPHPVP
jgi:outer membrane protein assembly factor BamE (lipoprotein component of BamABCDE complex)